VVTTTELSEAALEYLEAIFRLEQGGWELTSPALAAELKPAWGGLQEWGRLIRTRFDPAALELERAGLLDREPFVQHGLTYYRYSLPARRQALEALRGRYQPPRDTRSRLSPLAG
jgi:hypothetical protein